MKRASIIVLFAVFLAACTSAPGVPDGTADALPAGSTQQRSVDGMVMVYIPAGEFTMGMDVADTMEICARDSGSCDRSMFTDETPVHTVTLDAFWIDQTEVTNAMYGLCEDAGACQPPRYASSYHVSDYYGNPEYAQYPVMYVSWNDAQAYCQWVGARLPTEAEWEKAARGTDSRIYPWGSEDPGEDLLNYFHGQENADTVAVGSFPGGASPYGVLDMAGNVAEWVADWYDENAYSPFSSRNPQGPDSGDERVHRGGGISVDYEVRSASRGQDAPEFTNFFLGFRCASTP